jgi:hypothetical protein
MNLHLAIPAALVLLSPLAASAQTNAPAPALSVTPPPMKMGLWESDVTVQMSGMPNGVTLPPQSMTRQTCMTPETWKDTLQNIQARSQMASCTTANMQQDTHHIVFDATCTLKQQQDITTAVHVDIEFDSDESMHGTTAATVTGPNVPAGMTINSTLKSKYLGADCGSVKPGEQKDTGPAPAAPQP